MTKHVRLNLEKQPCVEDTTYSFSSCVKESVAQQVYSLQFYLEKGKALKTHRLTLQKRINIKIVYKLVEQNI